MKKKEKSSPSAPAKADLERLKNLALSENGFLFDPVTGFAYNLNSTAVVMMHQLQMGRTRDEILKNMEAHYDTNRNNLETDIDQFLGRLQEYGLLVWKR